MENLYYATILVVLLGDPTCVSPSRGTTIAGSGKGALEKYCSVLDQCFFFWFWPHSEAEYEAGGPRAWPGMAIFMLLAERRLGIHKNFTKRMVFPSRE